MTMKYCLPVKLHSVVLQTWSGIYLMKQFDETPVSQRSTQKSLPGGVLHEGKTKSKHDP